MKPVSRVLVTGASGFIGRHLLKLLKSKGVEVRALTRSEKSRKIVESLGGIPVMGDVLSAKDLLTASVDCDAIFHLAGIVSYQFLRQREMFKVNIEGTKNVINAIEKNNIKRLVYCSTISVLGGSQGELLDENIQHSGQFESGYAKSKFLGFQLIKDLASRRSGVVSVMPALAIGPGGDDILGVYIKAFRNRRLPFLISLRNPVSYVHVEDVAEGLFLCFEKGKDSSLYILAGDDCTPLELANLLERYTGVKKPSFTIGPNLAMPLLIIDELLSYISGRTPPLTLESLKVLRNWCWVYSSKKARTELGWTPRDMEKMVASVVN